MLALRLDLDCGWLTGVVRWLPSLLKWMWIHLHPVKMLPHRLHLRSCQEADIRKQQTSEGRWPRKGQIGVEISAEQTHQAANLTAPSMTGIELRRAIECDHPETFISTAIIGAGIAGMAQPGKALDC